MMVVLGLAMLELNLVMLADQAIDDSCFPEA
jgi:hypothetical protein